MHTNATYIVTGGAGFVGSNLVAALLARHDDAHADHHHRHHQGHREPTIIIVDDFRTGSFENIVRACARVGKVFTGEVLPKGVEHSDWRHLVASFKPAAVFHLGAITDTTKTNEAEMIAVNAGSFGPLLRACHEGDVPLMYASSAAVYGTPAQAGRREAFPEDAAGNPNNVYGFSKWLMECEHRRFDAWCAAKGVRRPRVVGLRYFNVFGPGEEHKGAMASIVHQVRQQLLAGKRPRLFVDGEQGRDQVPVEDVVSYTLAAAGLGPRGATIEPGVYNCGSGRFTTYNQLVAAVRKGLGIEGHAAATEYFEMPTHVRAFYQDFTLADMSNAKHGLGWEATIEPMRAMAGGAER